jgi:hypothetical protein
VDTTEPQPKIMTHDLTPRLRASDAERTATVDLLQDAMARGLLTHEESDERMAAAFDAHYRDELPPLSADLPPVDRALRPPAVPADWRRLLKALGTLASALVAATVAASFRSRRFLVIVLVVLALVGGPALAFGHGFFDGDYGRFAEHDGG